MPRVVAPVQATMEDLGDAVQETVRKANKVLDAAAAAKVLEGLGIGSGGSSAKDLSEVVSAAATALKSTGELQTGLIGKMSEMVSGGDGKDDLKDMMNRFLMMKMIEAMSQKPKEEVPVAVKEILDLQKSVIQELKEEIKELKESREPDPTSQQIQNLTAQLLSNHMATMMDPFSGITKLAEAKDKLKSVLGETSSVPPEYSEGALRLRALEKEEKALSVEENKFLAELNHKERLWSQQIPAVISQAGTVLANVLGSYGLIPAGPLQFDQQASAAAEQMAAMGNEGQ